MSLLEKKLKCIVCAGRGIDREASHDCLNGTGLCEECRRARMKKIVAATAARRFGPEAKKIDMEEETPKKSVVDWSAVQRDRDSGIPVAQLVKKYGVSNPSIYTRTHAPNGAHRAATKEGQNERTSASKASPNRGGFDGVLDVLRSRRDAITRAIEALESVGS